MSKEALIVLFVSALITVVLGVISWFLKDYLKGIRLQLVQSNAGMKSLLKGFHEFEKELIKIDSNLNNITSQQSEARDNIKEAKKLAHSNADRIVEHGHDIANLKANYSGYYKLVQELAESMKKIEEDVFVLKTESKK